MLNKAPMTFLLLFTAAFVLLSIFFFRILLNIPILIEIFKQANIFGIIYITAAIGFIALYHFLIVSIVKAIVLISLP